MENTFDILDIERLSFSSGFIRIFERPNIIEKYNHLFFAEDSDQEAMKKDWEIVGFEIATSIRDFEENKLGM